MDCTTPTAVSSHAVTHLVPLPVDLPELRNLLLVHYLGDKKSPTVRHEHDNAQALSMFRDAPLPRATLSLSPFSVQLLHSALHSGIVLPGVHI